MTSTTFEVGERLFCDTNVLLTTLDRKRALHRQTLRVVNELPNAGVVLCLSGQVIRELIVVASRPREVNGLGLSMTHTLENAKAFLARSACLEETSEVLRELLRLIDSSKFAGKQVHDANVVATMLAHGVRKVVTDNVSHFRRYKEITVVDLAAV